ncbi:MAG: PAS domain S-box protein [Candidatus Thorarchaeota archaeon]|nr:PAS domain S-box protein [Candidatus Thorarchaeota archaeon]
MDAIQKLSLNEASPLLEIILEAMPDAVFLVDLEGCILDCNDFAMDAFSLTKHEAIGRSFFSLGLNEESHEERIRSAIRGKKDSTSVEQFELELETPQGKRQTSDVRVLPVVSDDTRVGALVLIRDTTEQKRNQDRVALYREILMKSNDAIAVLRSDGTYLEQNAAHRHLLGYDDHELIGTTPAESLGVESFNEMLQKLLKMGRFRGDFECSTKSGRKRIVDISAFAISNKNGHPAFFVEIMRDVTKLREHEKFEEENEGKYAQIFKKSIDAAIVHDLEGAILEANQKAEALFGYSRAELLKMNMSNLRPNVEPEVIHRSLEILAEEGMMEIEGSFTRKDGTNFDAELHTAIVEIRGRRVSQAVVRDITPRKKAIDAMKESENRFRRTFEAIPDPAYLWELLPDDRIILKRVNSVISDFSKGQVDQWLFKDAELIFPSDPWVVKTLRQVMQTGVDIRQERSFGAHSGRLGWFVWYFTKPAENIVLMITTDMTEERHALEKLKASELQYRQLVETSPDAIVLTDVQGNIRMANQVALGLVGITNEMDILGRKIMEFVHSDDVRRATATFQEAFDNRTARLMEFSLKRHDGTIFPVEIRGSVITDADENPVGQVIVARDVSKRRRIEADLHYARERATLYLDLLAHDFRNQLQMILGGAEMALELATTERIRRALQEVSTAAQKCERMIGKVKSAEELLSKQLRETSINESIQSAARDFSILFPDVTLEFDLSVREAEVNAGLFLQDLWISLMENAAEHGKCKLISISLKEENGGYAVTVSDDGSGIPPSLQESLFDVNRRFGGVSLHVAKEVVDRCGGTIEVRNRVEGIPKKGAEFRIWLPKMTE